MAAALTAGRLSRMEPELSITMPMRHRDVFAAE